MVKTLNQILAADFSEVERRILERTSNDPSLRRAFQDNTDVHRSTTAEHFGVPPEEVTPDQRRSAKAANFGTIYGIPAKDTLESGREDFYEAGSGSMTTPRTV